jgi:hypothetical protein
MYLFLITLLSLIFRLNAKCVCSEGKIEDYFDDLNYVADSDYFGEIDLNVTLKNLSNSIGFLAAQGNFIIIRNI